MFVALVLSQAKLPNFENKSKNKRVCTTLGIAKFSNYPKCRTSSLKIYVYNL